MTPFCRARCLFPSLAHPCARPRNSLRRAALPGVAMLLAVLSWGQSAPAHPEASHAVAAEMQNVMYHFTESIAVHIVQLKGKLVPRKDIPVFDDKESFIIEIDSATISMSTDALAHVLNEQVFAGEDAPLKELSISTDGGQ